MGEEVKGTMDVFMASGTLWCRRAESEDIECWRESMEVRSADVKRCVWVEGEDIESDDLKTGWELLGLDLKHEWKDLEARQLKETGDEGDEGDA